MHDDSWLAERFEEHRGRLHAVAYRMLGSASDADDAVQDAWVRLCRADPGGVENLGGWLTTVVARICLNVLGSRRRRREETLGMRMPEPIVSACDGLDPEQQALLGESVGLALLVVLEQLSPAERVAFVLHDTFAVPFADIARILDRSPAAVRQLASRARRRVRGAAPIPDPDLRRQREVVNAFLAASSSGDFAALVSVLDPDVVLRVDDGPAGAGRIVNGADAVARQAMRFEQHALLVRPALVNGVPGVVVTENGRPFSVLAFTVANGRIIGIDVVADRERLQRVDLAGLDG